MKLKHQLLLLPFALMIACASNGTNGFELKGKLSNTHGEKIYLELLSQEGSKGIDTAQIDEKGEFTMDPLITEIGFYRLKISDKNFATLILDANQHVIINGDASNLGSSYIVEGSPDSKLFWDINKASEKNYARRDSLQQVFQAFVGTIAIPGKIMTKKDSIRIDSMSNQMEKPYMKLVTEHNTYLKNFIETNNSSFASLAGIQQLQPEEYFSTFVKLDDGLFAKYPNSPYIKSFHANIQTQKKLADGSPAPEITMNTPDDKPLSLSSLKGKYVLIDFWASWCGPCRAENPNVVKAYAKYKSKGFEVFSVSLDKDKEKWIAAIQKDGLVWPSHVCDFKYWQSPVVQLYNFTGIPYNMLLDKNGNIVARNLRGEDLEKKLAEVIK